MEDVSLHRLLERIVDAPIKLQIVLLFIEQTPMHATASTIASRMYRDIWSTRDALNELCDDGVLLARGEPGDNTQYRYAPRAEHQKAFRHLYELYNEPTTRDQVQQQVRDAANHAFHRQRTVGEMHTRL